MQFLNNKKRILLALTSLIFSISVMANDVVFINKGTPAPYSGILFTEQKAGELRKEVLESDKTQILLESEKQTNKNLLQIVNLKDKEIELYQKQNMRLLRLEDNSDTMRYVWFGLGVIVTGVAVYGAGGLAR
jgi:hypothetical protein